MAFRRLLAVAIVLFCGPALAAVPKGPPAVSLRSMPPMQFYVVQGAPDACGHGCSSWIAVEGAVDANAAARFRKFYTRVRDRNLPIYFASPGGNLTQAIEMGNLLRQKPAIARVGRTVVNECGFEPQDGEACRKLKQSGRELHGEFVTHGAFCGSACPYILFGATTREVAPDAALVVHSAKVTVSFRGPGIPPPAAMVAAANVRAHERSDQMLVAYFKKTGINGGLLDLVRTVKFEDMHVLTREEIVRFGIDGREFVETGWTFEPGSRNMVRKVALLRKEGEQAFTTIQWRVVCFDSNSFELDFQRPQTPRFSLSSISVTGEGPSVFLFLGQVKTFTTELWGARMTRASLQSLSNAPQTDFTEAISAKDGHKVLVSQKLSNDGFADALSRLTTTCRSPPQQQKADARDLPMK